MADDSVAQDQLRAFIERIERMENEKAEIAADIKEIYAEAKGNGFDTKILRKIVSIRKQDANERAEQEAVLDLYMYALGMSSAPRDEYAPKIAGLDVGSIDPDLLVTLIEGSKTEAGRKIIMGAIDAVKTGGRVAALRADPAMSIVGAADLKNKSEPQPAPQAGSDLTNPQAPQAGQVADIPEAKASKDSGATEQDIETPADSVTGDVSRLAAGRTADVAGDELPASNAGQQGDEQPESVTAGETALKYPAPGVVVWESTPPEGVHRHDYSYAFGDLGQDIAVIEDDISNAASEPIVKIGADILDGWARYNAARSAGIEYPVVQYDGSDPLMDCIRWNLAGRIMNDLQKRTVAQRLARIEPKRKAEIFAAMELGMELVGA